MMRAFPSAVVREAEEPLLARGELLMERASFALATHVRRLLAEHGTRAAGTTVLLLVGAGNNGGDALHAGALLARRGVGVRAALLTERAHEDGLAAARAAGVQLHPLVASAVEGEGEVPRLDLEELIRLARSCALWVDGLTGIGARAPLRDPLAGAVAALDHERRSSPDAPLVVAVDVPSGVGVDDGSLPGPVLPADLTVAMGALKPAHLLPPARAVAGRVEVVELDLLPGLLAAGGPVAACLQPGDVTDLWPVPQVDQHKYSRGVLHVLAGSQRYPGAAVLATEAAHRAGVGMVRLESPESVARLVLARRPEVVIGDGRSQAHVIGPGLDEEDIVALDRARAVVRSAVEAGEPVVLDATGLQILTHPDLHDLPAEVILTPHAGELAALLSARGENVSRAQVEQAPARHARLAAEITGATVIVKGQVTVVAAPDGPLLAQADGTPWLATAGAGDVLAGILGALLAGHGDALAERSRAGENVGPLMARLAAAAVLVHGRAARLAAGLPLHPAGGGATEPPGGPLAAAEVAAAVSATVRLLLRPAAGEER